MKNPLDEKQMSRLRKSVDWSIRQLETPRKKRLDAIKQYVGMHYADGGAEKRIPLPLLALALLIYVRQLAPRAPRALFTSGRPELKPTAANMELAINQIPAEIGLDATLRLMVTEAIFSPLGVVKVGLHSVGTALGHSYGQPFADVVGLDDYFLDVSARRRDLIDYEGNDWWADYDEIMESDWIDRKARDGLKPDEYSVIGPNGEDRAEGVSGDSSAEVFKDKLWLRDVWLPGEELLVTYGVKSERVLRVVEWDGPQRGPYHKLGYADVPGNLLPLPPVALWRDLHELANSLFRKLGNQADGQKTVLGFQGGNEESVEDFKKASDGDGIRYSGAEPRTLTAGGVDAKTLAFNLQCRDLFNYVAGNIDSLGGLSAMTETVGQDRLLSEAAGAQLRDMAAKTVDVIRDIFRSLAHYEWHDPIKRRTLEKPIPGGGGAILIDWGRRAKRGDFSLYDLQIDVYTLQDDSPSLKLQRLGAILERYILPLAPMIQQAGGTIDVQAILRDVARFSNMREVAEYVTFLDQPPAGRDEAAALPAHTTRTYQRVGRPGQTRQGASAAVQQLLLGANPRGSETAAAAGAN